MVAGPLSQRGTRNNPESTTRNFVNENETKTVENRGDENLDQPQSSDVCIVSLFVEQLSVVF